MWVLEISDSGCVIGRGEALVLQLLAENKLQLSDVGGCRPVRGVIGLAKPLRRHEFSEQVLHDHRVIADRLEPEVVVASQKFDVHRAGHQCLKEPACVTPSSFGCRLIALEDPFETAFPRSGCDEGSVCAENQCQVSLRVVARPERQ